MSYKSLVRFDIQHFLSLENHLACQRKESNKSDTVYLGKSMLYVISFSIYLCISSYSFIPKFVLNFEYY